MFELLQITNERQELCDVPSTAVTQPQLMECVQNSEVIDTHFYKVPFVYQNVENLMCGFESL